MLKLAFRPNRVRRIRPCRVYPGQRVSRKYRNAVVRRFEYRRLQRLIPSIARRKKVPELTVILEAVKYIDELHTAIADRIKALQGRQLLHDDRKRTAAGGSDVVAITNTAAQHERPTMTSQRTAITNYSFPHPAILSSARLGHMTNVDRFHLATSKSGRAPVAGSSVGKSTVTPATNVASPSSDSRQVAEKHRHPAINRFTNIANNDIQTNLWGSR